MVTTSLNASAGEDIVFGGSGDDSIDASSDATNDASQDIALGDNGFATFNNLGQRLLIQTSDVSFGGDDTITTGGGNDIIIGGSGDDDADAGAGDDYLLGDNGRVDYTIYDNTAEHLTRSWSCHKPLAVTISCAAAMTTTSSSVARQMMNY